MIATDLAGLTIEQYLDRHQKKELLRFLTCGSVDDGKSTLIGRLLHDTKGIYEDQLAAIKKDSAKHGTTGDGNIDLALLTDGLRAEREQGITIDVAYRYFSTDKRKFIIADTPGHEQYTRNMATGASTCHLAIILIDARYGVVTQTKRHSYICHLLGIKHLVIAVNKMDLCDFSQARFEEIKKQYQDFSKNLSCKDVVFIPLSALAGDNVVEKSNRTPWYTGKPLLEHLETVHIAGDRNLRDLRLPVQLVLRPNLDFRGFAGTIASGIIKKNDEVMVLPSGKKSRVKAIVTQDGELPEAQSPLSVLVTLTDEVDISRGDMLVHAKEPNGSAANREPSGSAAGNLPQVSGDVEAMVVWLHDQPLVAGKSYWVKHTTRLLPGSVTQIVHGVDVNTLEQHAPKAGKLGLNEVGRIVLSTAIPLVFDPYQENAATGAFILVDRVNNTTVGAGMIIGKHAGGGAHRGRVTQEEREVRLGQKGAVIWLREEAADAVERELFEEARTVLRIEQGELPTDALLKVARTVADQGILLLVSGAENEKPDALWTAELGERLIVADATVASDALTTLRLHGIGAEATVLGDNI